MEHKVDLSILIVNWNTPGLLTRCMQSVDATLRGDERLIVETVVVDNGSTDNSIEIIQASFPWARLIANAQNLGFARANNQAIAASRGEYVLLLNSDAFLEGQAAQEMLFAMQAQPHIGIAGAHLVYPDGRAQISHGPLPSLRSEVLSLMGRDKRAPETGATAPATGASAPWVKTGTVSGACLMARRAMLDEIGLLDEQFFMFSEEVDLCLRANRAGWEVVHLPQARVVHVGGGSTETSARRLGLLYQAKLRYFAKHFGPASRQALRLAMWAAIFTKIARAGLEWALSLGRRSSGETWLSLAREFSKTS